MAAFHPRARLDSYVEGALTASSRERVSAHLDDCADCSDEVEQRQRIHRAAASLGPVSAVRPGSIPTADVPETAAEDGRPLLERREGMAGWKVVLGAGAVSMLATGALVTAWIAGDPEATTAEVAPAESGSAAHAPAGAGLLSAVGAASAGVGPSGEVPSTPAADGAALATVSELTPAMVTDLRQDGWNVPSLTTLGLRHQATAWMRGSDTAEVVVTMGRGEHVLELHECRLVRGGPPAPACPVAGAAPDGPFGAAFAERAAAGEEEAGIDVVTLPVGVDMTVHESADGAWTATVSSAQATYAAASDLPVESAARVMTMVVISERSRVQAIAEPDTAAERLARGFERLLPWRSGTEPDPR